MTASEKNQNRELRVATEVAAEHLADGSVVLDLRTGRHFTLNVVGGVVWQRLEAAPATLEQIVDALDAVFDVPRARLKDDVTRLLDTLERSGLIRAEP
ncbi:MAG: PqqD family protein [Deltaproteobacteria bacterium]|jgi:hypothetical protein